MGRSISVDRAGNLFVCGHFVESASFATGSIRGTAQQQSGFLAKLDSGGRVLWTQVIGGHTDDECRGVAADPEGNCVVTGNFRSTVTLGPGASQSSLTSAGGTDIFLAKFSPAGVLLWAKQAGGSGDDFGHAVACDSSGNIFVTGSYELTGTFDGITLPGQDATQLFVAKYTPAGRLVWIKDIGGGESATGLGIAVDSQGGPCVTGRFNSGKTTFPAIAQAVTPVLKSDFFVSKYDANGKNLWYQIAGGSGNDQGFCVATDSIGNIFAAGSFENSMRFPTLTLTNSAGLGIFLARYDRTGKFLWAATSGGPHGGEAHGVQVDVAGDVYLSGYFYGTVTFGRSTLQSSGNPELFLAKFDTEGRAIWAVQAGGSAIKVPLGFALDDEGHAFLTGYFRSDATLGGSLLRNAGGRDAFVARIDGLFPTPRLNIAREAGQVVLRWPAWAKEFQLESTSEYSPTANWTAGANDIATLTTDGFSATNKPLLEAEFFRLRKR